jgi:hypothetical protein
MTTVDHPADPRVCAGLPHTVLNVSCTWCPHRQAWTVSLTGGQAEQPLTLREWHLGPFDGTEEAATFAAGVLIAAVRTAPLFDS